jgi:hypothetical protein
VFAVQGGSIQQLRGWTVSASIESEDPWTIDDVDGHLAEWVSHRAESAASPVTNEVE